ncbi:hypothetical protein HDU82_001091 [Entophlyctis luteolus]|nr:hypothetical protein HDU82_001091 [Entophlyctis luteolus]
MSSEHSTGLSEQSPTSAPRNRAAEKRFRASVTSRTKKDASIVSSQPAPNESIDANPAMAKNQPFAQVGWYPQHPFGVPFVFPFPIVAPPMPFVDTRSAEQSAVFRVPPAAPRNSLIPSDDPTTLARQEWEEERIRLRVEEARAKAAKILAEEETMAANELAAAEEAKRMRAAARDQRAKLENKVTAIIIAATVIQKRIRGYITRKAYPNLYANPVVLEKDPALYFLEKSLYELISEEFIPDICVEICEIQHFPAKYNTMMFVTSMLIDECAKECFEELAAESLFGRPTLAPLEPGKDSETYNSTITNTLADARANVAFEVLFEQVLDEMDIIFDSLLDQLVEYAYTFLLDTEIYKVVASSAFDARDSMGKKVLITRNFHSHSVTTIVERIIDGIFMSRLVDHIATRARSFLEFDAGDSLLDAILADILIRRFMSMRELEFDDALKDPE